MKLQAHRRSLVVWSSSARSANRSTGRSGAFVRRRRPGRFRRLTRTGRVLTLICLLRLARLVRPRWRPLLSGAVLTAAALVLHGTAWSIVIIPGVLCFYYALLVPGDADADHKRLAQELADYSTQAQRNDLEATLDRYPDSVTGTLRDILSRETATARTGGIPGTGPHG